MLSHCRRGLFRRLVTCTMLRVALIGVINPVTRLFVYFSPSTLFHKPNSNSEPRQQMYNNKLNYQIILKNKLK